MLLYKEGMVDLLHSTFQSNFATTSGTDGIGIVNMGGEVRCDTLDCLPVCTACLSPHPTPLPSRLSSPLPTLLPMALPTASPTAALPTLQPTVDEAAPTVAAADSTQLSSLVLWLAGFGFVLVGMVSAWCLSVRYCRSHSGDDDAYIQLPVSESIELIDSCITESSSESIDEAVLHSVMKSHEFSPGMYNIIVVCYVL